ncbi:hypothetical protein Btru_055032 [Bulinus truncatus]|nr:hypothetical protein Btru_055032 [Bulinus truncatus]
MHNICQQIMGERIRLILQKWPGKERFGVYRFLPVFFLLGAVVEFSMIKWRPFGVNFYDVFKNKEAIKLAENIVDN